MAARAGGWPVLQPHSPPLSAAELDGSLPAADRGAATFAGAPVLAAAWSPRLDAAGRRLLVAGTRALDRAPCGCGGGSPVGCVQVYRCAGGDDPALEVAALLPISARGCKVLAWAPFADGDAFVRLAAALTDGAVYVFAFEVAALRRLLDAKTPSPELPGGALEAAAVKEMILPSRRVLVDRADYSTQSLLWLPSSEALLIGRFDGTVSMVEVRAVRDGRALEQEVTVRWCTRAHDGAVVSLCLADENLLISAGTDGALRTRDMRRPSVEQDVYTEQTGWPTHVVRLDGQSSVCIAYTSSAGVLRVLLVGRVGPARGYPRQEAVLLSSATLQRGPLQALAYLTHKRFDDGSSDAGETEVDSLHFLLASGTHGLVHEVPLAWKAAELSDGKSHPGYWRIGRAVRVVGAWRSARGEASPSERQSAIVDGEAGAEGARDGVTGETAAEENVGATAGSGARCEGGCGELVEDVVIANGPRSYTALERTTAGCKPKRVTFADDAGVDKVGHRSSHERAGDGTETATSPAATANRAQISDSAKLGDNLVLAVDVAVARATRRPSNLLSELVPDLMAGQHGHWGENFDERVNVTSLALDPTTNFLVVSSGGGFLALTRVPSAQSERRRCKDGGRSSTRVVSLQPLPKSLQLSSQPDWPVVKAVRHGPTAVVSAKARGETEKRAARDAKKRESDAKKAAKKAAAAAKAAEKKKVAEAARAAKAAKIEEEERLAAEQQRLLDARIEAHIAKTMARKKQLSALKAIEDQKRRQEPERIDTASKNAAGLAGEAVTPDNEVGKAPLEASNAEEIRRASVPERQTEPHMPAKRTKPYVAKLDAVVSSGSTTDVAHRSMELEGSRNDILGPKDISPEREASRRRKRKPGKGSDYAEGTSDASLLKRARDSG